MGANMSMRICRAAGCSAPIRGRGWCGKHYMRWYTHGDPNVVNTTARDPLRRFHEKVSKQESWGCWEWTGSLVQHGYGSFSTGDVDTPAHRAAYEFFVGPIPEGLQIDHLCRNRACVNPHHLEPVTIKENILRGEGLAAQAARRDECSEGHAYTPENTYIRKRPDGSVKQRVCRTCKRARNLEYKARKRKAVA